MALQQVFCLCQFVTDVRSMSIFFANQRSLGPYGNIMHMMARQCCALQIFRAAPAVVLACLACLACTSSCFVWASVSMNSVALPRPTGHCTLPRSGGTSECVMRVFRVSLVFTFVIICVHAHVSRVRASQDCTVSLAEGLLHNLIHTYNCSCWYWVCWKWYICCIYACLRAIWKDWKDVQRGNLE